VDRAPRLGLFSPLYPRYLGLVPVLSVRATWFPPCSSASFSPARFFNQSYIPLLSCSGSVHRTSRECHWLFRRCGAHPATTENLVVDGPEFPSPTFALSAFQRKRWWKSLSQVAVRLDSLNLRLFAFCLFCILGSVGSLPLCDHHSIFPLFAAGNPRNPPPLPGAPTAETRDRSTLRRFSPLLFPLGSLYPTLSRSTPPNLPYKPDPFFFP